KAEPTSPAPPASGRNDDRSLPIAVRLDEGEQGRGAPGRQAHAAVRGGASDVSDFVGPVDRVAAAEEDRVGHRRVVVVDGRAPDALEADRMEIAGREPVADD